MLGRRTDLIEKARAIGASVAGPNAGAVDKDGRFPAESIAALKDAKLLSAFVPTKYGGEGCSVGDLLSICHALGQHCSASAMVFAMHQIQVACAVRHAGSSAYFADYQRELVKQQWLLASATSEAGIGGDARSSSCAVEQSGQSLTLTKNATTISYGAHADGILATARRNPDAPASDQVLVALHKKDYSLERTSSWDTLGMRGTCSNGFLLKAKGGMDQVLPLPYGDISAHTMLPVSHLTWAALWLGIATDAVSRARAFIRTEARKKPGSVPAGAVRLAEVVNMLQLMKANVVACAEHYQAIADQPEALTAIGVAIEMNNLKAGTSQMALQVVHHAMLICGIHGYKNDTKFSVGRHLRDLHSTVLMVNNDRLFGITASLLLVHKEDTTL